MNRLPEAFVQEMERLLIQACLGDEKVAFLEGFRQRAHTGLRLNPLKQANLDRLLDDLERIFQTEEGQSFRSELVPVAWSDDGYETTDVLAYGRSLAYRLGLYYIQEPSAMLPAQALGVKPGESVIDLCAAPGGKSARLAADLGGEGLLVSNDISSSRGRILVRNLEQLGVRNCVVTAADPVDLAKRWPGAFDHVLIDAPCSGEGMFRRAPKSIASWAEYGPSSIREIQANILEAAYELLRPGGTMVYSTCTFNRLENEAQIEALLISHPDLRIRDLRDNLPTGASIDPGISGDHPELGLELAGRIWPWRNRGEGHFAVLIEKTAETLESPAVPAVGKQVKRKKISTGDRELIYRIFEDLLTEDAWQELRAKLDSRMQIEHGRVQLPPEHALGLDGLHLLKEGLYLGNLVEDRRGNRFDISHSPILAWQADMFRLDRSLMLTSCDARVTKLLKGETIELTEEEQARLVAASTSEARGILAVTVDGYPLTWVKIDRSGRLKNLYPVGWRIQ